VDERGAYDIDYWASTGLTDIHHQRHVLTPPNSVEARASADTRANQIDASCFVGGEE